MVELTFFKDPDGAVRMRVVFPNAELPAKRQLEQGDNLLAINSDGAPVFMYVANVHLRRDPPFDAVARQMADAPHGEPVELGLSYQALELISDECQAVAEGIVLDWRGGGC